MIEYIEGFVKDLTPTETVLEANGIGYLLNITLSTFSAIEQLPLAKLYVHEAIREDAHTLFGFFTKKERELFRLLIGVSGVGASTGRLILSAIPFEELEQAIINGDHRRLTSAKGIGTKTAQRIIVDLSDKIKAGAVSLSIKQQGSEMVREESLKALVMLGFPRAACDKVLDRVFKANPDANVEVAIKQALAMF